MSYRHYLRNLRILDLLENAYVYVAHEIVMEGPLAFIGQGFYSYERSDTRLMFFLHARSGRMCWSYFQEVIVAFQRLIAQLGALEMVYLVNDGNYGTIAVGTFEVNGWV